MKRTVRVLLRLVILCLFLFGTVSLPADSQSLLPQALQCPTASEPEAIALVRSAIAVLSPQISAVHLTGSITVADSQDSQGSVDLYASPSLEWREEVSTGKGRTAQVYVTGKRQGRDSKGATMHADRFPALGADFSPAHSLLSRVVAGDALAQYIGTESFAGLQSTHLRVYGAASCLKMVSAVSKSQRNPDALYAYEDVFLNPTDHTVAGIRYFHPAEPVTPIVPSICRAPDGTILQHPNVNGDLRRIDCSAAHAHIPLQIEVRFSDYRSVGTNQIPFQIDRVVHSKTIAHIQLNHAETVPDLTSELLTIK